MLLNETTPKILGIPYGNGEKLSPETSYLINLTSDCCYTCLSSECCGITVGINHLRCMDLPTNKNSGLLKPSLCSCPNYN